MKKIIQFVFLLSFSSFVFAQEEQLDEASINAVLKACIAMQSAVESNDSIALREAADSLKSAGTANFSGLRCKDDEMTSLDGHFVFSEEFVDSLEAGADAYGNAERINRTSAHRGQSETGKILTKNCSVKAGMSTKYSFASRGCQELAVVAEAGGLITMKIHATNRDGLDKRFDDTVDVKKGRNYRKQVFDLPKDKRNTVELEVVNCSGKDISFVVISN